MSINRYTRHLFVLPEDDANRQLANGFLLQTSTGQVRVLDVAGGWARARDLFVSNHIDGMRRYVSRYMVLLIDFDGRIDRLEELKQVIPEDLNDRVFVLGTLTEPEELKQTRPGTFEAIGKAMAEDCRNGNQGIWTTQLLQHNIGELLRLRDSVCYDLFPA